MIVYVDEAGKPSAFNAAGCKSRENQYILSSQGGRQCTLLN